MLTKPAHAFSALQALLMAASAGSFTNLVDADFILDKRVVGGMQQVSERLAERLGDDVHLNAPVRTLRWDRRRGRRARRRRHRGARPAGPRRRSRRPCTRGSRTSRRCPAASTSCTSTCRWASSSRCTPSTTGRSGARRACPAPRSAPTSSCTRRTTTPRTVPSRGTLVGFVSDEHADDVFALSAEERKARVLASLAHYYGDEALSPVVYYESDWGTEEWTRGAYAASFDLGGLVRYGADQRAAVGPIRFASSDLAGQGYQHVDGAVRIGREVAEEILAVVPQPTAAR